MLSIHREMTANEKADPDDVATAKSFVEEAVVAWKEDHLDEPSYRVTLRRWIAESN